jgi:dephospho-CoA kinase
MQRSGLSRDQVLAVMATQASRQERQKAADLILTNDQGVAHLAKQVSDLHQRLIHS